MSEPKIKTKLTAISKLRRGAVIDWQGKPHYVREVTTEETGLVKLSLSWSLAEPDEITFKASAFETHVFTTRGLAPTLGVDRFIAPAKSKRAADPRIAQAA